MTGIFLSLKDSGAYYHLVAYVSSGSRGAGGSADGSAGGSSSGSSDSSSGSSDSGSDSLVIVVWR